MVIGRGTQRGEDRVVNGKLRGWLYGPSDNVQRWGENQVSSVLGGILRVSSIKPALPHEAHISDGDSGGAVFLKDGSVWKLAGINSDVDRFSSGPEGGGPYSAALFDMRGSYRPDGTLVTGETQSLPVTTCANFLEGELDHQHHRTTDPGLANISARVTLGIGDQVCIGGFIIQGQPKRVGIRGLGPSIEVGGVPLPGRIADPMLELHDAAGTVIFLTITGGVHRQGN